MHPPPPQLSVAFALLVVLAGNLPAVSSLAADETQGSFAFSNAWIAGQVLVSATPARALVVPSSQAPTAGLAFDLEARSLVVNVTTNRWVLVGTTPDDPSKAAFSVAKGSPEYEEFRYRGASVRLSSAANFSQMLARLDETQLAGSFPDRLEIWPADGDTWRVGSGGNSSGGSEGSPGSTRTVGVPAGMPSAYFDSASLTVSGTIEVFLWDTEISVEDESGETHSYRSGSTQQQLSQGLPPQANAAARERIDRLVFLRAENASADLLTTGRPAALAAQELALAARGDAEFFATHGHLTSAAGRTELVGDPLGVAGEFFLTAGPQQADGKALRGDLTIDQGTFFPGESALSQQRPASTRPIWGANGGNWPNALVVFGLAAFAAIAVLLLAALARRLNDRRIGIDDAELSLLGGKTRSAIRQARAILRRDALDADALFVLGAAHLKAGKFSTAVRELGRRCRALPIGERRGVAFLLALAGLRLGRTESVRQWAAEAKQDPILAFRLGEEGWPEESPEEDRAYA